MPCCNCFLILVTSARLGSSRAGAVGNWLEVVECIETLHGNGPADLEELVVVQSAQMLLQSGVVASRAEGVSLCKAVSRSHILACGPDLSSFSSVESSRHRGRHSIFRVSLRYAMQALRDGSALAKFREMVEGQGGDVAMVDRYTDESWHPAANVLPVCAAEAGVVQSIDALSKQPVPPRPQPRREKLCPNDDSLPSSVWFAAKLRAQYHRVVCVAVFDRWVQPSGKSE